MNDIIEVDINKKSNSIVNILVTSKMTKYVSSVLIPALGNLYPSNFCIWYKNNVLSIAIDPEKLLRCKDCIFLCRKLEKLIQTVEENPNIYSAFIYFTKMEMHRIDSLKNGEDFSETNAAEALKLNKAIMNMICYIRSDFDDYEDNALLTDFIGIAFGSKNSLMDTGIIYNSI